MFTPKFLYLVDNRVNQWLTQCSQNETVVETSLELVNLSNIITKLQLNEFVCYLPPNIKEILKDDSKKRESSDGKSYSSGTAKNGKKVKQENVMIRNEATNQEWNLKNNKNWSQLFRHKSKDAPFLSNGCRACLKYQVKCFCFDNCKFKASHCQLTGEDYEKTVSYVKLLRE